jgi:hypothetical protein
MKTNLALRLTPYEADRQTAPEFADAAAYGNQFPAYRENPMQETLRAVEGLSADAGYARQCGEFQRLMVYGETQPSTRPASARCANCLVGCRVFSAGSPGAQR